jgi:hypothetical protein
VDVLEDVDTVVDPFVDEPLQCQGQSHRLGLDHHGANEPAAFDLVSPCCGDRILVCATRADFLKYVATTIKCCACGREHANYKYGFIPIT